MIKQFTLLFLVLCAQAHAQTTDPTRASDRSLKLIELDSYAFRRAYHGSETLSGDALDKFMQRDPEGLDNPHTLANHPHYAHCLEAGIFGEGNLHLNAIDTLSEYFEMRTNAQQIVQVERRYVDDPKEVDWPSIILTFKAQEYIVLRDTLQFDWPADVTFFKQDLDQDGREELLVVHRWYIMNGDNFDLKIYGLKENE